MNASYLNAGMLVKRVKLPKVFKIQYQKLKKYHSRKCNNIYKYESNTDRNSLSGYRGILGT